jgi:hypothetical protein
LAFEEEEEEGEASNINTDANTSHVFEDNEREIDDEVPYQTLQ